MKLAIIGASYLQLPLIERAKELGYETHVFAWEVGDVGEKEADVFHPISIIEKEAIYEECQSLGVAGICSIASDLAAVTVNYVSDKLGFPCNDPEATLCLSNKHAMRTRFFESGIPSPRSILISEQSDVSDDFRYPLIVKPTDRSGSRGVSRVDDPEDLAKAIDYAKEVSFSGEAVLEEYVLGDEYSIEGLSVDGTHHILAITRKYTTGAPHFVETAHLQPAPMDADLKSRIIDITCLALDSMGMANGATHTELKVSADGEINLIEVGGRMGGDHIGSSIVPITTGVDYVKAVIDVAVGNRPDLAVSEAHKVAAIRFVFNPVDIEICDRIEAEHPEFIVEKKMVMDLSDNVVLDSSERYGYYILQADRASDLEPYLVDLQIDER